LVIGLGLVFQLWLFFASLPNWTIKEIQIINYDYVPLELIQQNLKVDEATSLLKVSRSQLIEQLQSIPQIKSITIHKKLPSTLIIDLTIRKPLVSIEINNHKWVTDDEGEILNQNLEINTLSSSLPRLQGLQSISEIKDNVSQVAELIHLVNASLSVEKGYTINNDNRHNIYILLNHSHKIIIGEPTAYTDKINVLEKMLIVLKKDMSKIEYIDVRAPHTPTVKYKSSGLS